MKPTKSPTEMLTTYGSDREYWAEQAAKSQRHEGQSDLSTAKFKSPWRRVGDRVRSTKKRRTSR